MDGYVTIDAETLVKTLEKAITERTWSARNAEERHQEARKRWVDDEWSKFQLFPRSREYFEKRCPAYVSDVRFSIEDIDIIDRPENSIIGVWTNLKLSIANTGVSTVTISLDNWRKIFLWSKCIQGTNGRPA